MNWVFDFSKDSIKFIRKNNLSESDVINYLRKVIGKLKGEKINIDLKKMKGTWSGYFRLRWGKIRIIFTIDFYENQIYIDRIDFRGEVYK